jgi:hypothetical protein
MGINTKLLAGAAVVVLLLGVSSQIANHAFAFTSTDRYSDAKAVAKAAGEHAAKLIASEKNNKITPPGGRDGTG